MIDKLENKKRPGSASWRRYEAYKNCTTTIAYMGLET
jgi:hypothetical protein